MSWITEFLLRAKPPSRQANASMQVTRRHRPVQHQRPAHERRHSREPHCGWLGAKDWNPPLVNIYAVTSILWFFFAVALFGWFLYLGITDKWRRYFVSDVTPGWFWFSVFWQALWALVRLLIANIVGKFAQLLQNIGRQRMSEVEQQGRRAVLVYY